MYEISTDYVDYLKHLQAVRGLQIGSTYVRCLAHSDIHLLARDLCAVRDPIVIDYSTYGIPIPPALFLDGAEALMSLEAELRLSQIEEIIAEEMKYKY